MLERLRFLLSLRLPPEEPQTAARGTLAFPRHGPRPDPGGYIHALSKASARGERSTAIGSYTLDRAALAVVTLLFLVTTLLLLLRAYRLGQTPSAARVAVSITLLLLTAGLCVTLALAPPNGPLSAPLSQILLLLVTAVSAVVARLATRRQKTLRDTDPLNSGTLDALTRVANHRFFQDRLLHECERSYRFGEDFMLVLIDIDNFRTVNSRHGHRVGDAILLDLARRMKTQLRDIDLLARFGGDRFALVLPRTNEAGGLQLAERIRQNVAAWVFFTKEGAEVRLTLSLGLSACPGDGTAAPALVEMACNSLAFAKEMGGNQVQLFRELPAKETASNVVSLPHSGREAIVRSLAAAVDIRDGYTHTHSNLVKELASAVARCIGLPSEEVGRIGMGALLHDVGKIGIPDSILTKEGGLSPDEWDCIREHPDLGRQILEQAPELKDITPLVLHHQERYDGTGYPTKLRGEDIPLGARIIAAADAYHAIVSDRPYRPRRSHTDAVRELSRCSGAQFDPQVVETLLTVLETDQKIRSLLPHDPHEADAMPSASSDSRARASAALLAHPGA